MHILDCFLIFSPPCTCYSWHFQFLPVNRSVSHIDSERMKWMYMCTYITCLEKMRLQMNSLFPFSQWLCLFTLPTSKNLEEGPHYYQQSKKSGTAFPKAALLLETSSECCYLNFSLGSTFKSHLRVTNSILHIIC